MNLSISCQQTRKKSENGPTYEPRCRTFAKIIFIFAIQLFYGCQRNARKYITVTVSVRVSATVRVSVVWFSLICSFGGVKCRHLPAGRVFSIIFAFWLYTRPALCIVKCSQLSHGRPCESWLHLATHTAGRVYSIVLYF